MTRVLTRAVLHVMMIMTTGAVNMIRVVDATMIAGATTTVDTTRAAGVTAEGIAVVTATLTPWIKDSDRSRSRSRDRDDRSSSRSDTRSRDTWRSGRSDDANIVDCSDEDCPYIHEGYHVDVPIEAASKSEPAVSLKAGEAKLSSRSNGTKARQERLFFLHRQPQYFRPYNKVDQAL